MSQRGMRASVGPGKLQLSLPSLPKVPFLCAFQPSAPFSPVSGNTLCPLISTPTHEPVSDCKSPPDSLPWVGALEKASSRMLTMEMTEAWGQQEAWKDAEGVKRDLSQSSASKHITFYLEGIIQVVEERGVGFITKCLLF